MLRDLVIQNYRAFENFRVDDLARVNLIVGMNNTGKTSLLEAVYLLVSQGDPQRLLELLRNRGELVHPPVHPLGSGLAFSTIEPGYPVEHLFHDHRLESGQSIRLESHRDRPLTLEIGLSTPADNGKPLLTISFRGNGGDESVELPLYGEGVIEVPPAWTAGPIAPARFLTTNHLGLRSLAELWDGITLTPKEESVVAALQILDPSVERISFTSRQTAHGGILVKRRGQRKPIPLGSLGDGMRRMLTLAASAVMSEGGVLLVDEIDTGLYYQTQTDMWRALMETAQQLNVQIFATTHSSDCVRAFQETLTRAPDSTVGRLFRLSLRGEAIRAVAYTADELTIAVRQDIEVR